jgi:hypothetical protein
MNKISLVLQKKKKNKGFKTLQSIYKILNGELDEDNFSCNLTPGQISLFKYLPNTSCDVERSFSQYKAVLRSNRRSLIFENLNKYVIEHVTHVLNVNYKFYFILFLNYIILRYTANH